MQLESIQFTENHGGPGEWVLDGLTLGASNLIVGKNASGKSRTLNVINGIARALAGTLAPPRSAIYDCIFVEGDKRYRYECKSHGSQVVFERLSINDRILLDRGANGEGTIRAEELGQDVRFQSPPNQFAAVARRDSIQHKYLEPLHNWASAVRHYAFGSSLGKENLAIFIPNGPKPDVRDPNAIVGLFRLAQKEFGDRFEQALIRDLASIGYQVDKVGLGTPSAIEAHGVPGELMGLVVNESDLPDATTDQVSMSQGMFRALALLIHINYFSLNSSATCVLVDDIGEGLDFDRSCRLIDLLRERSKQSNVQIILSTNDRFVMNRVPLEEWSVLQRKTHRVGVRNFSNSRALFEEFKFTGLSNFSFLEMDLVNTDPPSEHIQK